MKILEKALDLCEKMYDELGIGHIIKSDIDYCEVIQEDDTFLLASY